MAFGSSVPPRAYTREILTTAFNWLHTQPESVRAKATTPDALVGLYLATTNKHGGFKPDYGQNTLQSEAPVSSQAFMSDLKNLAEGLKEFEGAKTKGAPAPASHSADDTRLSTPAPQFQPVTPVVPAPRAAVPAGAAALAGFSAGSAAGLNDRSVSMLREVQLAMNLSSETEAMNMMIALAYKNLKSVIA